MPNHLDHVARTLRLVAHKLDAAVSNVAVIKKIASKTKIGNYDLGQIIEALNQVDPGWSTEEAVVTTSISDVPSSISKEEAEVFAKKHGLTRASTLFGASIEVGFTSDSKYTEHGYTLSDNPKKAAEDFLPKMAAILAEFTKLFLRNVEVGKTPANPVLGQVYVSKVSKPEVVVQETMNNSFRALAFVQPTGVKRGVEGVKVHAPNGKVLALSDPTSPSLWTFVYKMTDAADKAKAFLEQGEGQKAVKELEVQKKIKQLGGGDIGTCAVCLNQQKLRGGTLVLHGYLRPGWGWIDGECDGTRYQPWEVSPEGLEAYVNKLENVYIPRQEAALANVDKISSVTAYVQQPSGHRYQLYTITDDGFVANNEYTFDRYSTPRNYPRLDVSAEDASAKGVLIAYRKKQRAKIEGNLQQMRATVVSSKERLASWKAQPLPGKG